MGNANLTQSLARDYSLVFFPKQWYTEGGSVRISMSVSEGPSPRSLANFCRQAADLVRVRSLSCTRNGRARHFRQKNTHVLAQFPSDPVPGLLWPRCLPDASQMPPSSPLLPDVSKIASPQDRIPKKYFDFFVI